jgi:hypothetical protein
MAVENPKSRDLARSLRCEESLSSERREIPRFARNDGITYLTSMRLSAGQKRAFLKSRALFSATLQSATGTPGNHG